MLKLSTSALLLVTLAGCGATSVGSPVSRAAIVASVKAVASNWVITSVEVKEGPNPNPGHLYPISEDFTITGRDAKGAFSLVLESANPGGNLYVPKATSVTLNGQAVPQTQFKALAARLDKAKVAQADTTPIYRASSILNFTR